MTSSTWFYCLKCLLPVRLYLAYLIIRNAKVNKPLAPVLSPTRLGAVILTYEWLSCSQRALFLSLNAQRIVRISSDISVLSNSTYLNYYNSVISLIISNLYWISGHCELRRSTSMLEPTKLSSSAVLRMVTCWLFSRCVVGLIASYIPNSNGLITNTHYV